MQILIDTNRYRDFCMGAPDVVQRFQEAEIIHMAFVTLAELRAGFLWGTRARANEKVLAQFLSRPRASLLFPDEETTFHYAQIYLQLRRQGTPIPSHDMWIAALAEQHRLLLYSRDSHFDQLPQLPRLS